MYSIYKKEAMTVKIFVLHIGQKMTAERKRNPEIPIPTAPQSLHDHQKGNKYTKKDKDH